MMKKLALKKRALDNKKGFTLIEIIVVLVILAILAAASIPTMIGFVNDSRGKALVAEARTVFIAGQTVATELQTTNKGGGTTAVGGEGNVVNDDLNKTHIAKINSLLEPDIIVSDTASTTVGKITFEVGTKSKTNLTAIPPEYGYGQVASLTYEKKIGAKTVKIVLAPPAAAQVTFN